MTEASGATSNPLTALKPLVVVATNNYAASVVLDVDSVTRDQRDAAIAYLNKLIGSGGYQATFSLDSSGVDGRYALSGTTSQETGSAEFRTIVAEGIKPKFRRVGELKIEIARTSTRHMIGVECTLTASSRGSTQTIEELETQPREVHMLVHDGTSVTFSLEEVDEKKDSELIGAALRVAEAFGIYVETPPTKVADRDPKARLYPEFNYVKRDSA